MNEIPNETYYLFVLPGFLIALPILYLALAILWNKKWAPRQKSKGQVIQPFSMIIGNALRLGFKEDNLKLLKKVNNKLTNKLLSLKGINWILLTSTFILLGLKSDLFWIPALFLLLSIAIRTTPIINQRKQILNRMFAVASSVFKYGRGSDLEPWKYVRIKKWETFTTPGETHVSIPATFDTSGLMSRDGFERHFNSTVTDENSWVYEWKGAEGTVVCRPINHLPTMAEYPGSEKHPWNIIPLGIGSEGEVTVDLTKTPHMLICGSTGSGKNSQLTLRVLTAEGWSTIGELEVGDEIFGVDGKLTKVTHLHPVITPAKAYEITFNNGEKVIVDDEHLWETETRAARLSRFSNVRQEPLRKREHFLTPEKEAVVKAELARTVNSDTISIAEVAKLTGKSNTTGLFFDIAKQVGAAEVVNPKIVFHYDAQIVKQKQTLAHIEVNEFINLYNTRRPSKPSRKFPLRLNNIDKLKQLSEELRSTDIITLESILKYVEAVPVATQKWFQANFDTTLSSLEAVKALTVAAEGNFTPLPDKIFSIEDRKEVNIRDFSSLLGIDTKIAKPVFHMIKAKATNVSMRAVEVELVVGEKTLERSYIPYNTYPKALFLQRLLVHNELESYNQENKREFRSVKETGEIFDTLWSNKNKTHKNHSIRRAKPLELPEVDLPINPYVFGAWLGDGYSTGGTICGEDHEIFDYIESLGYEPTELSRDREIVVKGAVRHNSMFRAVKFNRLHSELALNNLKLPYKHSIKEHGEVKHIPEIFLLSSIEQRRELLRGLLDTDGGVGRYGTAEFYTSNPALRTDVKMLIASLGYIPFVQEKQPTYNGNGVAKKAYTISFQASPSDRLFFLPRKNKKHSERFTGNALENSLSDYHFIVDVREVQPVPMRCVSVDSPDRLFLVSDSLIPTHNSVLQRNLLFHCIQHNDSWRFIGIDVKKVELTPFKRYTQTVLGIGSNLEDGVDVVRYVKKVMETRYEKMEEAGVNHFSNMIDEETGKPAYALMLMVDEAFMFMSPEGSKSDEGKVRDQLHAEASTVLGDIARLGRAAGIHLVLATQRPDATVIRGELKANLDIRIAAGRLDSTPSSMVLDSGAATQLPGHIKGRGIVRFGGEQHQFQGYFAPQEWIDGWLSENPGREPELYPIVGGEGSPSLMGELADLGEDFNFDDGISDEDMEEFDTSGDSNGSPFIDGLSPTLDESGVGENDAVDEVEVNVPNSSSVSFEGDYEPTIRKQPEVTLPASVEQVVVPELETVKQDLPVEEVSESINSVLDQFFGVSDSSKKVEEVSKPPTSTDNPQESTEGDNTGLAPSDASSSPKLPTGLPGLPVKRNMPKLPPLPPINRTALPPLPSRDDN